MISLSNFDSANESFVTDNDFLAEVILGLSGAVKSLPCKYFYDEAGSKLFDTICESPEYYPTRTELKLMKDAAPDIATAIGSNVDLIEYGSGASKKVRCILDALEMPASYVAVDISRKFLMKASRSVAQDYPGIAVHAVCADFTKPFDLPKGVGIRSRRSVGYFPGSTIGNFTRLEAKEFLKACVKTLGPGGGMLVGVDLKKDPITLEAAYNDAAGVTKAFNLNILSHINRELSGNFDLQAFDHVAFYNKELGRIEMHLESFKKQSVTVSGNEFYFEPGERIHTESSYKYNIDEFQALASSAGFVPSKVWTDSNELFSVHFLRI